MKPVYVTFYFLKGIKRIGASFSQKKRAVDYANRVKQNLLTSNVHIIKYDENGEEVESLILSN